MASGSWNVEIESKAAAARLFKAALVDWHNLGPKVLPEIIASANPVAGDGNVGSIRQINFTSGNLLICTGFSLQALHACHLFIS